MRFRKPKFYWNETWKQNFWFCLGWPEKMIEAYIQKEFNHVTEVSDANGKLWEAWNDKGSVMVIWTRDIRDFSALVHECVHAANFTLQRRGWKPDFDNDEPLAYLVEAIFRNGFYK